MVKSILNNSSVALSAGSSFVGAGESVSNNVEISVSIKSDRNCLVRVEQSVDKTFWDALRDFNYLTAGGSKNYAVGVVHQYVRVSVVNNSGVTMSYMRMSTSFNEEYSSSVAVGTDATGIERKIAVDDQGKLLMTFVGEVGPEGKSAYQVALDEGFVGDESAWLLTLKGIQGNQGIQGVTGIQGIQGNAGSNGVDGSDGADGDDGLSSYQVWLGLGNSGTQEQFIQSLKGASILVKGTLTTAEILALNIGTLSFGDSYFSSDAYTLYVFDGSTWVSSGSLRGMAGATGGQGIQGIQGEEGANVLVLGNVATASALPTDADVGHSYFVNDTFSLSVSRGPGLWASSLSLRGPTGLTGDVGPTGPQGVIGPGVVAKGSVVDVAALNALPTPSVGDLYIVEADYKMYIWDGSAFQNSGVSMRGTAGADGVDGTDGVDGGTGPTGATGPTGSVGLTGNSIVVMGNVATASALPTGYDADDVGKAWFVVDTYVMSVWDGSAFQSSASLRGPQGPIGLPGDEGAPGGEGLDGASINFLGSVADATALATASSGWGVADLNKTFYQTDIFSLQVWNGSSFVATGSLRGEQGIQGIQGVQGYSFDFQGADYESNILGFISGLGVADTGKVWLASDTYKLYVWNGSAFVVSTSIRGEIGPSGSDGANLLAKGNVADATALSAKVATAVIGDMWFQDDVYTANVFDGAAFQSSGSLRGPVGAAGADAALATPSIITYSVASGTSGGAAPAGSAAWSIRPLNGLTNSTSNGGVTLNTNIITIASAGTFKVEFMGVVHAVGNHKVRLLRINGAGGTIGVGQNDNASNGNSGHSHNVVTATFAAGDQLRLEHYIQTAANADDLGAAVSSGEVELYARVVIEKLA